MAWRPQSTSAGRFLLTTAASARAVVSVSAPAQRRIVQVDGAVAAHGQARAQRLLDAVGAERHGDHLALAALLLDPQRLLHGELVVGRDDPRDAGGVDGCVPSPPIFTWVAVSGTCLIVTRIFMRQSLLGAGDSDWGS